MLYRFIPKDRNIQDNLVYCKRHIDTQLKMQKKYGDKTVYDYEPWEFDAIYDSIDSLIEAGGERAFLAAIFEGKYDNFSPVRATEKAVQFRLGVSDIMFWAPKKSIFTKKGLHRLDYWYNRSRKEQEEYGSWGD